MVFNTDLLGTVGKQLLELARYYRADKSGNVAMLTGLTILPIMIMVGGSIDVSRATSAKQSLQVVLDNAVLAATNLTSEEDPKELIENFVNANMASGSAEDLKLDVVVESYVNGRRITADAKLPVDTTLLNLIGRSKIDVGVRSVGSQFVINTEIALALDISSSMRGSRVTNMKLAVEEFLEDVLDEDTKDYTSISIVPFGGTVNLGDLFDRYVVDQASANVDPSKSDYENSNEALGKFRFTEGDRCIENDDSDYDLEDIPLNSRSQVPHFWKWNNFNPWCPTSNSSVFLNSNDKTALIEHVRNMNLSDGTGMEVGALWAAKALSPALRGDIGGDFPQRPFDFDSTVTNKVMIVMADGGITSQLRPDDYSFYNTHTNRTNKSNYGNGSGNNGNNKNQWTAVSKGNINNGTNRTAGRYAEICDAAKENGITIFTIGYQISNQGHENLLKSCATNDSYHYDVESLDISSAFASIASALDELRVEQ